MVFYQVIIVSVLHFRNLGGTGGQESMVQPKDTCPAVPLALPPISCSVEDPAEKITVQSQSSPQTRPLERLSCLYKVYVTKKRFFFLKKQL